MTCYSQTFIQIIKYLEHLLYLFVYLYTGHANDNELNYKQKNLKKEGRRNSGSSLMPKNVKNKWFSLENLVLRW